MISQKATKGKRRNLFIGLVLITLVSVPTLSILSSEFHRTSFSPDNSWLLPALVCLIPLGFTMSVLGLLRRIHWGYFCWSQLVLSFIVLTSYIGWHRRELDYVKMGPDPGAVEQGPPIATVGGFLILVVFWLIVGFLPLAIRSFITWHRRYRKP